MYPHTSLPIRPAIAASHHAALERFVSSGTWFWGHERHAMLKEARHASLCRLCAESRMALSPLSQRAILTRLQTCPSKSLWSFIAW